MNGSNHTDILTVINTIAAAIAAIFAFLSSRHSKTASVQSTAAVAQSTDNSVKIAEVKRTVDGPLAAATQSSATSSQALADAIPTIANLAAAVKANTINENLKEGQAEARKP